MGVVVCGKKSQKLHPTIVQYLKVMYYKKGLQFMIVRLIPWYLTRSRDGSESIIIIIVQRIYSLCIREVIGIVLLCYA